MPKYPGISPYDNEKGTLGTAKKRWEKLYVKEIESDTVSGINASIENLATTAENSVSAAVSAKNDAVAAKQAAEAAQTAAETAAAGIQSVVETDVDNTLSIAGVAADAKVTGDWLRDIAKPVTLDTSLPATAYAEEYMKATTDSEGRVLYGVKRDGTFTWQKGVPKHVVGAISKCITDAIDNTLTEEGNLAGASVTGDWLRTLGSPIENPEYLYVMMDSDGHVLFCVKRDGSVDWQKGLPKPVKEKLEEVAQTVIDSDEYLYVMMDSDNRVMFGVKKDGSFDWQKGIPSHLMMFVQEYCEDKLRKTAGNVLYGVRWVAMGDSHTANRGYLNYRGILEEQTGIVALNYGFSGSGYHHLISTGQSFYDRIQTLADEDFDVCTIWGSTNDIRGDTLGNITDTTTDTVFGCVNLTIEAYYDIAIDKPLGIVSPMPLRGTNRTSASLQWEEEYVNGLRTIAEKYYVPFVDMMHNGGIPAWHPDYVANFCVSSTDFHINTAAHRTFIAPKFRQFLLDLVWE